MSEDTIYREDAIKATWQEPTYTDPLNVLTEVRDRIEAIPSADRPQGEWVFGYDDETKEKDLYAWTCSLCGGKYPWQPNYCPNCGAEMREREGE